MFPVFFNENYCVGTLDLNNREVQKLRSIVYNGVLRTVIPVFCHHQHPVSPYVHQILQSMGSRQGTSTSRQRSRVVSEVEREVRSGGQRRPRGRRRRSRFSCCRRRGRPLIDAGFELTASAASRRAKQVIYLTWP